MFLSPVPELNVCDSRLFGEQKLRNLENKYRIFKVNIEIFTDS